MNRDSRGRRLRALLLVLAVTAVYAPALGGGFLWDDWLFVARNPWLRSASGLARVWTDPQACPFPWYPLTVTSFWLEFRLWGEWPFGYHLTNVLLHAANAVLFGGLLESLGIPGAGLAAARAFVRFSGIDGIARSDSERRRAYLFSLAAFAAALLAKTAVCPLPAALLVLLWWRRGELRLREVASVLPLAALAGALASLTLRLETGRIGASGERFDLSAPQRLLLAARVPWFYLGKLFWPEGLTFFYPRWSLDGSDPWQWVFPLAGGALGIALVLGRHSLGRGPLAAFLCFTLLLGPVLGLANFYFMVYSFVADHYVYLPSLAPIALAAAALSRAPLVAAWKRAAATLCVASLAVLASAQARDYRDEETLWRRTVERNPGAWMARTNLGWLLAERGELEAAAEEFEAALATDPKALLARTNLGIVRQRQGRLDEALEHFREALRLAPEDPRVRNLLAVTLAFAGRRDEAALHFREALRRSPHDPLIRSNAERLLGAAAPPEPPGAPGVRPETGGG